MLLERRTTPRYGVDDPAPITLDSVVEGTVVNASETGLAIATPYKPVVNSVVRISVQLPDNASPCDTSAQVVRSASSCQIGLKLLKPESFCKHFETWRRFSTQQKDGAPCTAAQPQADIAIAAVAEPSLDLEGLRAAILQDAEKSILPIFSRTVIIAGVIACVLLAATMWLWYGRTHKADANVQASVSPAEPAPAAMRTPEDLTQRTSESAPTADAPADLSTLEVARSDESTKSAVVPKRTEHQGTSHAQIVVNLDRFSRVKPKLLHKPDRIYLDLGPGTRPKVSKNSLSRAGNRLVRRIRIGQAENGRARVVLDLRGPCEYQAKVSPTPPYKLIINIRANPRRGTS